MNGVALLLLPSHLHSLSPVQKQKGEEKQEEKKHPAAQAVDVSFHQRTHAGTHAAAPFTQRKRTGADIKAHTFKCTLTSVIAP